jgi:rare lipoprotein A
MTSINSASINSASIDSASIDSARVSCVDRKASDIRFDTPLILSARVPAGAIEFVAVVLGAASLAGCAQSSVVSRRSAVFTASRPAAPERYRAAFVPHRRVTVAHAAFAPREHNTTAAKTYSQGLASFYTEGQQTASGERFDTNELTAAHPTLPFGTRLRVTNVTNGQSVTVRINDRGPYVPGRVVDVSYSAARSLGMVGDGVAKVKLDVVQ